MEERGGYVIAKASHNSSCHLGIALVERSYIIFGEEGFLIHITTLHISSI